MSEQWVKLPIKLALALVIVLLISSAMAVSAAVEVGDKAPDFTLGSVDGKSDLKLSSYTDKPTILVFWVSWCPHCQREVPIIGKVYNDLKPKGLNALGVSVDDDMADAQAFVKDYDLKFSNAFAGTEKGEEVLNTYGIRGVPTTFILDKGGTVKAHYRGVVPEEVIREDLAKLGVK